MSFLTPGPRSGIRNRFIPDSGSRIPNPYILELSDKFLGKKFGSGINIKDPQHCIRPQESLAFYKSFNILWSMEFSTAAAIFLLFDLQVVDLMPGTLPILLCIIRMSVKPFNISIFVYQSTVNILGPYIFYTIRIRILPY